MHSESGEQRPQKGRLLHSELLDGYDSPHGYAVADRPAIAKDAADDVGAEEQAESHPG